MASDRYGRHSLIDWFSQERVSQTRVAVVGAGAVGNEVIKNLTLLGAGRIDIFDFDHVEKSNLTRSVLFRETDVGFTKADMAALRARALDPNVEVHPFSVDVWQALSIRSLQRYAAIFCCVDNFETRLKLNKLSLICRTDLINIGIDSRFASVEVFPFSHDSDCPCYECGLPPSVYQRVAMRYSCGWLKRAAYHERKIPTTIITSSMGAAFAVSIGLRLGDDTGSQREPARWLFDTIGGHTSKIELTKNQECAGCARIVGPVAILPARRMIEGTAVAETADSSSVNPLTLSDRVIVGYACANDARHTADLESKYVFKRASDFTDEIAICPVCKEQSIKIEITDVLDYRDLMRFEGREIPCKFATVRAASGTVVLDFEAGG